MRKLTDAYFGAVIYKKIVRKKKDVFFLFLLDNDLELNYYAMAHLKRYAEINDFANAEIICPEAISIDVQRLTHNKYHITTLSEKKTQNLLSYVLRKSSCAGIPILDNIRLITLQHPYTGMRMVLSRGVYDKEYFVWKMFYLPINKREKYTPAIPFKEIQSHINEE